METIHHWMPAASCAPLLRGEVHVWSVALDCGRPVINAAFDTLSADERDRAARFHFDRDRRRFVCARGALRQILGEYLDVDPVRLSFGYGVHGKPSLNRAEAGVLSFNVSHSGELALVAVAPGDIELGVDVEEMRAVPDRDDIARQCFAPSEVARLQALPPAMREGAFFRCWTRKEAYLKALGDGLAKPLDSFDVSFGVGEPEELRVIGDRRESERWTLAGLEPADGFAAALVARRGAGRIECSRWTGSRPFEARTMTYGAWERV